MATSYAAAGSFLAAASRNAGLPMAAGSALSVAGTAGIAGVAGPGAAGLAGDGRGSDPVMSLAGLAGSIFGAGRLLVLPIVSSGISTPPAGAMVRPLKMGSSGRNSPGRLPEAGAVSREPT